MEQRERRSLGRGRIAGVALGLAMLVIGSGATGARTTPAHADVLAFDTEHFENGGFEPRIAVGPDGTRWVSTQGFNTLLIGQLGLGGTGPERVYSSPDGHTWTKTSGDPPFTLSPCCDNDVVVTPTGRVISAIIDNETFQIVVAYSDDGGATWTESKGTRLGDQDREWLAVGPKDSITGQNTVYMLWHNLFSGTLDHEMWVSTSRDNGATFLPPVPITLPGSQAWLDLQCADSGGPSNIVVNPGTGQIYAVFGTRSSALGGCGASALGAFEINIVAATRIWVSTSGDEGLTWSQSLAVDDSAAGNIVGMQVSTGALDNSGNLYITYPESPNPYPDYSGAAIRYRWAPGNLSSWSAPVTVAPAGGPGHILAHMVAGDAGKLGFFYVTGVAQAGTQPPAWYADAAETLDGQSASPTFTSTRIASPSLWTGTASQLEGVCPAIESTFGGLLPVPPPPSGPPFDTVNTALGTLCPRASDVLGMAVDATCHFMFTWYSSAGGVAQGTYVSTQTSGPTLGTRCGVGGLPALAMSRR